MTPESNVLAWERPGLDAFTAFGRTIYALVSSPRKAFESMPLTPRFGRPLVFGIIVSWIGILSGTFWNLLLRGWLQSMFPWANDTFTAASSTMRIVAAMAAPIWIPVGILIAAGLQHLFLFLVGGAKSGFIATFRVQCYAGATMVLAIIPACGSIAGVLGSLILAVIGLSVAHRITTGKAAAAVLLPLLLCCGCFAVCIAVFGAAIMAALGGHR